jgi:hypothetical protein
MLNPSQKQRLERQKLERQVRENKEEKKESKKSYWKNPQEKANFNKTMRHKLEDGLRGLSDMVLLLESLPPNVLENAKLEEYVPKVTKFVEVFLEKADFLPVAEHESGEQRTFRNYATYMENHVDVDAFKRHIKYINGNRYLIDSINVTASPIERHNFDVLQKHIEHLQRYIDPSIIVIDDKNFRRPRRVRDVLDESQIKRNMMGHCGSNMQIIEEHIPTNPPCKPRALIDGMFYDILTPEEETPAPPEE